MTKLPPDDPVEYRRWVEDQPEEERERLLSHQEVVAPAREVTYRIWADQDLRSGWRLLDPTLRTCIAQNWLHGNRQAVERASWAVEETLGALIKDEPDHPLWTHFETVTLNQLSGWHDLSRWGIGLATRLYGPDIEAVAFFPPGVRVFETDSTQLQYLFLMRYDEHAGWRVYNLHDRVPEPGWPPHFGPAWT
jgi:hypothetical protein